MKAFFKDSDKIIINSMDYTEALVGKTFLNNVATKQVKIEQRYDVNDDFDGLVISLVDVTEEESKEEVIVNPVVEAPKGVISYITGLSIAPEIIENEVNVLDGSVVSYYLANPSVGNNADANRFGLKITAPTDYEYDIYKECSIKRVQYYSDGTISGKTMKWSDVQDSETHYETWPNVTEDLTKVEITIAWTVENIQTFTISIGNIVLATE